jgi:2-iminobutanoate/2-iminopropanoate deaminase
MAIERINPPSLVDPGGHYHHVVKDGNIAYLSGQVGIDRDRNIPTDPAEQIEQAFKNIEAALAAVGSDMHHITKWTVYLTNIEDFPALMATRARYIPDDFAPAGTLIVVAGLAYPSLRIEIDVTASVP